MTETTGLPRLVVRGGADDGAALEIPDGQEAWIGSGPDCTLILSEPRVAPLHARVSSDHWGVRLFDASGGAGTWVNGDPVGEGRALETGDVVTLGKPGAPGSVTLVASVPERSGLFTDDAAEATALDDDGVPIDQSEIGQQARALAASGAVAPAAVKAARRRPGGAARAELSEGPAIEGDSVSVAAETPAERSQSLRPRGPRPADKEEKKKALPRPLLVALATALLVGGGAAAWIASQGPPPTILGITPPKAEAGQDVSIAGTGFAAGAVVRFDGQEAEIASVEPERVIVKVPQAYAGKGASQVRITVEVAGARSATVFLRVFDGPRLAKLSPEVAMPGEEVVVTGERLEGKAHEAVVRGLPAEVLEVAAGRIRLRVPDVPGPQGQQVPVSVKADEDWSNALKLVLGRLPIVIETVPPGGQANQVVTLNGYGFAPDPAANRVTFGGRPALVLQSTPNTLTAVVPGGDAATSLARAAVAIEVGGVRSGNPLTFALSRPSGAFYLPRFFAEPAPGAPGRAIVSCEAGPVLLLADAAGGGSVARRAVAVAEALNAHFVAARPGKVERRGPEVLVGGKVLVAATAVDAAAHDGAVGAETLAAHWTALLADLTTLFALKDRPTLLLERTARAAVLDQLWKEARRVAPGAGVPPPLVAGLGASGWRALRELALTPVPESASSGGLAVVGAWQGELQAPGQTARPLQLRLAMAGGRLEGFVTARAGKVTGDLPLRDVALRGRAVRFTFDFGDGALAFEGTLAGARLAGTVRDEYGGSGTLTLALSE
ncbi:MAG: IPT/TIG domain-containing protein [Vicinamibacteria bacterium]|nr:IPT/TIG domain-containing protein [Vicinamibacteria bacterium]